MEGNQFIVAIVAIIFGTAFGAFILYLIFSTIKSWINRKNSSLDDESFDRMAQAFIKHKKNTERRLENLEAAVADDEMLEASEIEIEQPEPPKDINLQEPKKNQDQNSGNLKNILKE